MDFSNHPLNKHSTEQLSTATGLTKLNSTVQLQLNAKEQDILFSDLSDLTNVIFKAWYCQAFGKLGREKVLRLASEARSDGRNKPRYFSYLIKQELLR